MGKAIDILAILATLFGVAVSLGLGTLQIAAGLSKVFGLPNGVGLMLIIIGVTAVAYMLSASTPIEKGVNYLSQASMYLAFVLLIYFLVVGPTILQLNTFAQDARRLPGQPRSPEPQDERLRPAGGRVAR